MNWYSLRLPDQTGTNHFRCFQINQDIAFTRSSYYGQQPFYSEIYHPDDITLLVFGLKGESHFGQAQDQLNWVVTAGDIWLFKPHSQPFYRYSPPNICHEMAVLKIPTTRITRAFSTNDNVWEPMLNNNSAHIAIGQDNEQWIAPLTNNPLETPFQRLEAEGQVLNLIAHWLLPLAHSSTATTSGIQPFNTPALTKAKQILMKTLTNPPSLEVLSKQVGMSHTLLNRNFKKTYGKTVFNWLRSYRLELAKSYLQDQSQTITTIAHSCGFSSASHFTQVFHQHESCTPAQYRNRLIQKGKQNVC